MSRTFIKLKRALSHNLRYESEKISGKIEWKYRLSEAWLVLQDALWYNWVSKFHEYKECLERVIYWVPKVWRNYDWEGRTLFDLMRYKIQRMRKLHTECRRHDPATIKQLMLCDALLDRIIDSERYCSKEWDEHYDKYGHMFCFSGEKRKVLTEAQEKARDKNFKRLIEHEDYMYKQDLDYLFKTIKKHSSKWWD